MFVIFALAALALTHHVTHEPLVRATISTNTPPYALEAEWDRPPALLSSTVRKLAKIGASAIVRCDTILQTGRLEKCTSIKWKGAEAKNDEIALSSVRKARLSKTQLDAISGASDKGAGIIITFLFDGVTEPVLE